MTPEIRDAVKLVSQKVQRCETAIRRKEYDRAALEIKNAELAVKDLRQLITDEAPDGRS